MVSRLIEAWTAEARRKSLETRQAHAKGKIDGPSAKHDAAPKLPDQSAVSGVVSEIFAEGRKMMAGGKIEHTEEEKGWIAKGYAHPDDIGTFRKARDVVEKINKLHDMSLTLHPKRRPLAGAAGGLYDTNKGEISLVARYKQSKESGGNWAGRPQTDEELTQTLGHEIAHHYEYGHNQRHRDTEEHFVGLVRKLWNGESVSKSSLPTSTAAGGPEGGGTAGTAAPTTTSGGGITHVGGNTVAMHPQTFLDLAVPFGHSGGPSKDQSKVNNLAKIGQDAWETRPMLSVKIGDDGGFQIGLHDGRHRASAAIQKGESSLKVDIVRGRKFARENPDVTDEELIKRVLSSGKLKSELGDKTIATGNAASAGGEKPKSLADTAHEHSAKAEELSTKAKSENTADSHKAAFTANHNAASYHLKAANEALDKGDIKAAAEHSKKQDEHMSRALFHDQSRAAVSG